MESLDKKLIEVMGPWGFCSLENEDCGQVGIVTVQRHRRLPTRKWQQLPSLNW